MHIPETSRTAVLRLFGEPLKIEEVPVPKVLEPRSLLVRTETCTVCGSDVHLACGRIALKAELPVIIGHEMVGRVVAKGEDADRDSMGQDIKIGDRTGTWAYIYEKLITSQYGLDDVNIALDRRDKMQDIKPLIRLN